MAINCYKIRDILLKEKLVKSNADFKRLIKQGAIKDLTQDYIVKNPEYMVFMTTIIKVGKKRFLRIPFEKEVEENNIKYIKLWR